MSKEFTQIKISEPLIDDIELNRIDNFYNDIVDEYMKYYVKEKDQIISQRLMKNLRKENEQKQKIIDRLSRKIQRLKREKTQKEISIMKEITDHCDCCLIKEKCCENECALFRIEQAVLKNAKERR